MSLAAALAPYGMHVARASSPLRLRGGVSMRVSMPNVCVCMEDEWCARTSLALPLVVGAD